MKKGRVVFVVGYSNWGKSRTLRSLTNGNSHQKLILIQGTEFFIRRMSNDDKPKDFYAFIDCVDPADKPQLIVAFCPEFHERRVQQSLETLQQKRYRLFFWVLRHQYGTQQIVRPDEITELRRYGRVEIFDDGQAEDTARARALRAFIETIVLA
jgi:hypothetical protein